jgi:hypothetical protein
MTKLLNIDKTNVVSPSPSPQINVVNNAETTFGNIPRHKLKMEFILKICEFGIGDLIVRLSSEISFAQNNLHQLSLVGNLAGQALYFRFPFTHAPAESVFGGGGGGAEIERGKRGRTGLPLPPFVRTNFVMFSGGVTV